MKFILNEAKFILNESYSFTLDERFILDEELLIETAVKDLSAIIADINKIIPVLPQLDKVLPTGIKLSIADNIALNGNKAEIEKQIQEDSQTIQDFITKKDFKGLLAKVVNKGKQKQIKDRTGQYTKEELETLASLIRHIMSDIMAVKSRLSNIAQQKNDIATQITSLQGELPRLKTNIEELYKLFEEKEKEEKEQEKYKYSLTETEIALVFGNVYDLNSLIKVEPKKEFTATFEAVTPNLIEIDEKGKLKARAVGETDIKIVVDGQELVCKVIIQHKYSLVQSEISLSVGDTYQVKSLVKTEPEKKDVKTTFTVTKPEIATIDDKEGKLKALAEGETEFKVVADDHEFTCKAIVKKAEEAETQEEEIPEAGGED